MRDSKPRLDALTARWKALRGHGISVREVACVGAPRTVLLAELGSASQLAISLSAGIHGDEPAASAALLSLAEDGLLDGRFAYRIWPCTNPTGLEKGTRENAEGWDINRSFEGSGRTPEAKAIITANRDRRFVLSLDLHEDLEASGFYCYEPVGQAEIAPRVIAALDAAGLPVQDLVPQFDLGYPQDADHLRTLERGRVLAHFAAEAKYYSGLPYSLYLAKKGAQRVLTMESPATRSWNERIAIHRVAVVAAIAAILAK